MGVLLGNVMYYLLSLHPRFSQTPSILMSKDKKIKLVPHDFKYHAEIMYETQDSFNFDRAVGNTIEEIIKEIREVLIYRKDRNPKIRTVLYDPNNEGINITRKILTLIEPHTEGVQNEQTKPVNRRPGGAS